MARAEAMPNQSKIMGLAQDPLRVVDRQEYADDASEIGYGVWSLHRVDLHHELRRLATTPTMPRADAAAGPPVQIRLGHAVERVDCEEGVLMLAGGHKVAKDLVIIADGAHVSVDTRCTKLGFSWTQMLTWTAAQSRLVSDFVGRPFEAHHTGRSMDRWLVPMDKVAAKPDLAAIFGRGPPGFMGWIDRDGDVLCITYRCRGGKLLNVAVAHKTRPRPHGEGGEGKWNSPASKAEVLDTLKNFHRSLQKLVGMADEDGIQSHHLYTRPPLESFVRGRAVMVGDAAHVMKPTHAAGAGIAIESAATLEVLFRGFNAAKDAPAMRRRLELFDELRIPRCNLTMLASNAARGCFPAPGKEEKTLRRFYSGPLLPPSTSPYSKACRKLLFDHDEFRAAEDLLYRAQAEELWGFLGGG